MCLLSSSYRIFEYCIALEQTLAGAKMINICLYLLQKTALWLHFINYLCVATDKTSQAIKTQQLDSPKKLWSQTILGNVYTYVASYLLCGDSYTHAYCVYLVKSHSVY